MRENPENITLLPLTMLCTINEAAIYGPSKLRPVETIAFKQFLRLCSDNSALGIRVVEQGIRVADDITDALAGKFKMQTAYAFAFTAWYKIKEDGEDA